MYTIYQDGGDTQIFERPDGTKERNEFVFTSFGNGIHPYHRKQLNWIIEMLNSASVKLTIQEVPTEEEIGINAGRGQFKFSELNIDKGRLVFDPAVTNLLLLQDKEMGRGFAVLVLLKEKGSKILMQDHRDNVRDQMMGQSWMAKHGVELQYKDVENIDKL